MAAADARTLDVQSARAQAIVATATMTKRKSESIAAFYGGGSERDTELKRHACNLNCGESRLWPK